VNVLPAPTSDVAAGFIHRGGLTVDTPLTDAEITGSIEAIDRLLPYQEAGPNERQRYRYSLTCDYVEPALLDLTQHPFFEEVAKEVLDADAVRFYQSAIVAAYPEPGRPWSFDQHVDIQYRLSDFHASPRRVICSFFLWLTDVNERRAPMMFRPRSHLLLAEENERRGAGAETVGCVKGVVMERLPPLPYAEPEPLLARAGQVSVLTTAAVHGASVNVDDSPRKSMVITFVADGVTIGLPPGEAAQKREYDEAIRPLLRPERRHIVQTY
jgi:hypothetical protein